jgi:hypothetical protein
MQLSLILAAVVGLSGESDARTWTDKAGRKADASFVAFDDALMLVTLKRLRDGKQFTIPVSRLSYPDQSFIEKARRPVTKPTLAEYERCKRLVVMSVREHREETKTLVTKLGLKIESAPKEQQFLVCSWKPPLTKQVIQTLQQSELIEYVEPDISGDL